MKLLTNNNIIQMADTGIPASTNLHKYKFSYQEVIIIMDELRRQLPLEHAEERKEFWKKLLGKRE